MVKRSWKKKAKLDWPRLILAACIAIGVFIYVSYFL